MDWLNEWLPPPSNFHSPKNAIFLQIDQTEQQSATIIQYFHVFGAKRRRGWRRRLPDKIALFLSHYYGFEGRRGTCLGRSQFSTFSHVPFHSLNPVHFVPIHTDPSSQLFPFKAPRGKNKLFISVIFSILIFHSFFELLNLFNYKNNYY